MPNMREIARLAGVSLGTVSLALRDDPRVRLETRARIKAIADEYHYLPNRLGQALFSGRSGTLGCVIHQYAGQFYSCILQGILDQAYAIGIQILVKQTNWEMVQVCQAVRSLLEHRVEGIIFALAHPGPFPTELLFEIRSAGAVPVCIINNAFVTPIDLVAHDEEAIASLIVEYLRSLGHREIGYIGTELNGSGKRTEKMQRAIDRYGLKLRHYCHLSHSYQSYDMVMQWLRGPYPPTAIMASDDTFAESLLFRLASQGIRIPQDLSIIGTGKFLGDMFSPVLTTVDLHPHKIGQETVNIICRRLAEHQSPADYQPETITFHPELLVRETSGPAP